LAGQADKQQKMRRAGTIPPQPVGGVASAAFNPAVAVGISMMGMSLWSKLWVYLVANLLGGAAAGWAFRGLAPEAEVPAPVAGTPRTNP
jgi:glycerol uptake facilitator-like aquaporin